MCQYSPVLAGHGFRVLRPRVVWAFEHSTPKMEAKSTGAVKTVTSTQRIGLGSHRLRRTLPGRRPARLLERAQGTTA